MSEWTRGLYVLGYHWKGVSLVVVLGVLSFLLFPPSLPFARATTVLETSFSALVHDAEVIAIGTVSAIAAEWDVEKKAPFTLVTFSELEILKGEAGQTELTLHFLGGPTPDGLVMQIAGTPQFHVGERAVVFVTGNETQAIPLVGLWQGVYRVVFDAERGVDTIHNHASQPVTRLPAGPTSEDGMLTHNQAQQTGDSQQEAMSLDTFTDLIEQELRDGQ